tara:strand:+ start:565 stop:789 length:225 start_codon:yes stop_codon:yes gene_type:complete
MLITQIFDLRFFIFGLLIGVLSIYFFPKIKNIVVYPNDEHDVQFVDNAQNCFEFNVQDTSCPINPMQVINIPIQ